MINLPISQNLNGSHNSTITLKSSRGNQALEQCERSNDPSCSVEFHKFHKLIGTGVTSEFSLQPVFVCTINLEIKVLRLILNIKEEKPKLNFE